MGPRVPHVRLGRARRWVAELIDWRPKGAVELDEQELLSETRICK